MMKTRVIFLLTSALLHAGSLAIAQNRIPRSVMSSGGGTGSNEQFRSVGTVGQTTIGKTSNNDHLALTGFWAQVPEIILAVDPLPEDLPSRFQLEQNYPNPFNPSTTIQFEIPQADFVTLEVYTLLGQEVATLVNEVRPAGRYTERFDAAGIASGVYLYRLTTPLHSATKKLVLVR